MENEKEIRTDEWITPPNQKFSYEIYWPYKEAFNPLSTRVNIYVRLPDNKTYVGTFVTTRQFEEWFKEFRVSGHYASGSYIPGGLDIIAEEISHKTIEKTIEDLLKTQEFYNYFKTKEE